MTREEAEVVLTRVGERHLEIMQRALPWLGNPYARPNGIYVHLAPYQQPIELPTHEDHHTPIGWQIRMLDRSTTP